MHIFFGSMNHHSEKNRCSHKRPVEQSQFGFISVQDKNSNYKWYNVRGCKRIHIRTGDEQITEPDVPDKIKYQEWNQFRGVTFVPFYIKYVYGKSKSK